MTKISNLNTTFSSSKLAFWVTFLNKILIFFSKIKIPGNSPLVTPMFLQIMVGGANYEI